MRLSQQIVNIRTLLFIGIFILLNLLVYKVFFRIDLTADKRYTLSSSTKNILDELEMPVTITAHFSQELPTSVATIKQDFQDLLYEYQSESDGQLVFEFINPNKDEQTKQQSQQQGIPPMMLQVREKDRVEQMEAYMGAVVKMGTQQEVIPFVGQRAEMEYNLSRSIKRLAVTDKASVGFIQGHGEPAAAQLQQTIRELSTLYEVDTVSLSNPGAWSKFKTLVLLAPADSFAVEELSELDLFLGSGGGLVVGINRVGGDLSRGFLGEQTTGLESWLADKGVEVRPEFITDARSGMIGVQQQMPPFGMVTRQIQFPYVPLIVDYADHPITEGLEAVSLFLASPVEITVQDSTIQGGSLAFSSQQSNVVPPPVMIDIEKRWTENDFPLGPQSVGVWLEGRIAGDAESKLVVIGDGDFAIEQQGQQDPNNLNLIVNAVDWTTDDTGLIELRTKGVENRLIDQQLSDGTRNTVKWLSFLLPLILVMLLGLMRNQKRKAQRNKWIQQDFS